LTPIFALKNRHGVYLVENPVDNCFSLRNSQKIGTQHDGKNLFCELFLIFSKNFSVV